VSGRLVERGRVGIEPEADLAAALFDERRQPISKNAQRESAALDFGLQGRAGGEARNLAARDGDPFAGPRVDALARAALGDVEFAETGERNLLALAQSAGDRIENSVNGVAGGFFAAETIVACKLVQKLSLGHVEIPPRGFEDGRNLTAASA
jgi:hypothetical protein